MSTKSFGAGVRSSRIDRSCDPMASQHHTVQDGKRVEKNLDIFMCIHSKCTVCTACTVCTVFTKLYMIFYVQNIAYEIG